MPFHQPSQLSQGFTIIPYRQDQLVVVSANMRGFRTNVPELTHSYVLKNDVNVVVTVETFLDASV